ncbi:MAG: hypothetical protein NXH75_04885 [Halobacteriovoraceae bacterium]|nr:hypothetical protein [Halobacteriovoraceae bacterium]
MLRSLLILGFLVLSLNSFGQFTLEEKYKQCVETCLSFEEPGFALRKCVTTCRDRFEEAQNKFCTSFEDFCDDDDDDVWGGL